ncbi:MAG: hypothetical protein V1746_06450 [bacterium]
MISEPSFPDAASIDEISPALDQEQQNVLPFATGLNLSEETLTALTTHCEERIRHLSIEMGRGLLGYCAGWMGQREKWLKQYNNDWAYRKAEEGGVFVHSNYSMNFAKKVCSQLTARTNREFFGSEPYFAVKPEGANDAELADRVNRRSQWKFSKSNAKAALREAVKYAYILGERVVKICHLRKEKRAVTEAPVLVDEQGDAVLTAFGNYVRMEDWLECDGSWVCRHDISLTMPENPRYEPRMVEWTSLQYNGPHLSGVHFRDFLCPLNVADIHEADFICHLYDRPLWSVAQTYNRLDLLQPQQKNSNFSAIVRRALNTLLLADAQPKSALTQPSSLRGEEGSLNNAEQNQIVQVAECYLKYDVNNDGLPEDICVILAMPADTSRNATPIYYDYCANILPNGRWPFEVVRRNPDEGRWYGVGVFEEFNHKQDFIDLHFNRINFRNMTTGTVKFWKSRDVEEEREPFTIGDDKIWTPRENAEPSKIFTAVPLLEPTQTADLVMRYMMQSFQLEAGASNEVDSHSVDLPTGKTATGVLSNEKTADELTHSQICDLEDGLAKVIQAAVLMDYYHMDAEETYEYLEGNTAKLEWLSRQDVENLSMNVRLLLTRRRSLQTLASNAQAIQTVKTYMDLMEQALKLNLPLEIVSRARQLFVQTLKSLEIQGAEEIFLDPAKIISPMISNNMKENV